MAQKRDEKTQIRAFGLAMAVFLSIIGTIAWYKGREYYFYLYYTALGFLAVSLVAPVVLKPLFWVWMKIAYGLGWFNTRLLLSLVFFLIFTPVGVILRLLRKDLIDQRFRKQVESYWDQRQEAEFDKGSYERQF